jgi:hypothetical protein
MSTLLATVVLGTTENPSTHAELQLRAEGWTRPEANEGNRSVADTTQPDQIDVALKVLLAEPTYAAQTLTKLAGLLQLDPGQPMTGRDLERAIDIAAEAVLTRLPDVVARDSMQRMYRALPDRSATVTRGEYALLLRQAAKDLDAVRGDRR